LKQKRKKKEKKQNQKIMKLNLFSLRFHVILDHIFLFVGYVFRQFMKLVQSGFK